MAHHTKICKTLQNIAILYAIIHTRGKSSDITNKKYDSILVNMAAKSVFFKYKSYNCLSFHC